MTAPTTIAIIIPDLKGNGAERVMLALASGFKEKNCNVHIIIFKNHIELAVNDVIPINIFEHHYRWIPRAIRGKIVAPILDRFIEKVCGQKPNLVLSNLLPIDRILAYSKLNVFMVIHNTISQELYLGTKKKKNQLADIYTKKPCICVSKGVMADFQSVFSDFNTKRITYIYNPIDINSLNNIEHTNQLSYKNYLIHVGKFKSAKRHDILIKAYAKSGLKNPLLLLGQGPLLHEAKSLVKQLNLEQKIIFLGFHQNPYPLIEQASLMVLSSDFEGLPTVILEATALGTPVISTDCPSGPSEILPAQNLCSVRDIEKLSQLMKLAIAMPEEYKIPLANSFLLGYATQKYLDLLL